MLPEKPVVLFVDDHRLLRHALAEHIAKQAGIQTLEASNGMEALEIIKKNRVDVMILDVEMPVMNGRDAFIEAKKVSPALKVIVYTYLTGVENLLFFIFHGVDGFISKADEESFMNEAILCVIGGEKYFPKNVLMHIKSRLRSIPEATKKMKLSARELQLIHDLKEGKTSKEISLETGLSTKTVDTYRERLLNKTQTENTVALVSFAVKNGLIRL
jgi:DNA-binding NarL/FixJ family response regulator